jgi:hypothetical protein
MQEFCRFTNNDRELHFCRLCANNAAAQNEYFDAGDWNTEPEKSLKNIKPMKSTQQMSNFEKDRENSDENNLVFNAKHNAPNWPLISDNELHVINMKPMKPTQQCNL